MSEWIIVAVVGVVLLFSAKKLPDMARGLGQSMRIFKAETRGLREDDDRHRSTTTPDAGPPAVGTGTTAGTTAPGRAAAAPAASAAQEGPRPTEPATVEHSSDRGAEPTRDHPSGS